MDDIERILTAIDRRRADTLLLATSFDGVLVDYESDPAQVELPASRRSLLQAVVACPDIVVCILSGRRADDLRERAGLGDGGFFVGLHGLETQGPDYVRIEREIFERYPSVFRRIAATVEQSMAGVSGVLVEDKEAAVAVHTRDAGPQNAVWARLRLLNAAAELVNSDEVRAVRGNHVFELMPNLRSPRAGALEAVRRFIADRDGRSVTTLYIGEDVADDDAFDDACARSELCAVVGRRRARAAFHLSSTDAVWQLIERLPALRLRS